jgi:NAD(P)-dependent dehydrogenase (short-subunit alcohol dehydrogenase family)
LYTILKKRKPCKIHQFEGRKPVKIPGLAVYSSSKGAVITLSELLAEGVQGARIAFNVLALKSVQTEMLRSFQDTKHQ